LQVYVGPGSEKSSQVQGRLPLAQGGGGGGTTMDGPQGSGRRGGIGGGGRGGGGLGDGGGGLGDGGGGGSGDGGGGGGRGDGGGGGHLQAGMRASSLLSISRCTRDASSPSLGPGSTTWSARVIS